MPHRSVTTNGCDVQQHFRPIGEPITRDRHLFRPSADPEQQSRWRCRRWPIHPPFVTGNGPVSVAFSPGGGLLATANVNGNTVSVFAVGSGGALTPVEGSPFVTGNGPRSVAFGRGGGLLATANSSAQHGVGVRGRSTVGGDPCASGRGGLSRRSGRSDQFRVCGRAVCAGDQVLCRFKREREPGDA